MTRRDNVPDEIVDRQREDTFRPSAAPVTSVNVESASWLVALVKYRLAGDQRGGRQSVGLLRGELDPPERQPSGAQPVHHRPSMGAVSTAPARPSTRCSSREP